MSSGTRQHAKYMLYVFPIYWKRQKAFWQRKDHVSKQNKMGNIRDTETELAGFG